MLRPPSADARGAAPAVPAVWACFPVDRAQSCRPKTVATKPLAKARLPNPFHVPKRLSARPPAGPPGPTRLCAAGALPFATSPAHEGINE